MIKFTKLTLRNFVAYGNTYTTIDLSNPGTTLISGENGVGKTSLMNALTYALYNRAISDFGVDELINWTNKKAMEVKVEFEKNGSTYLIHRYRKLDTERKKNDTDVKIWINGKDKTRSDADKQLIEILGLTYDMFVHIIVISAAHEPFLDMTGPKQTDFMERLVRLTMLSDLADALSPLMKDTNQAIKIEQTKIEQLEKQRARHQEQLASAQTRVVSFEKQNQQNIVNLETTLASIANIDFDKERNLQDKLKTINEKLTEVIREQRGLVSAVQQYERNTEKHKDEIETLHSSKCPYCKQQFKDTKAKLEEVAAKLKQDQEALDILLEDLKRVETTIPEYRTQKDEVQAEITVPNLDKLLQIKNQSETMAQKLEELRVLKNPHIDALEELEKIVLEKANYEMINAQTRRIEHQQFLYKLLTKKDSFVRKGFLSKNLPFLNNRLKINLQRLKLPFKVEFTSELTVDVTQMGQKISPGQLSGGQKARVDVGLALSFHDLFQELHNTINVCFLDEVLDHGLDVAGIEAAVGVLNHKAKEEGLSMFITTHREVSETMFDRAMYIITEKGFAVIS